MRHGWIGIILSGLLVTGLVVFPGIAACQRPGDKATRSKLDQWKEWRPLVGIWEGKSEGRPGIGKARLEVSFVLDARYLKIAGIADYTNKKGGQHHEDFGFVSYDSSRKTNVFRQFHGEGFVNQYVLTSDPNVGGVIELTSESCENSPSGWKVRERYTVTGDTLDHTFESAPPNKPFEIYVHARLSRREQK